MVVGFGGGRQRQREDSVIYDVLCRRRGRKRKRRRGRGTRAMGLWEIGDVEFPKSWFYRSRYWRSLSFSFAYKGCFLL